MSEKEIIYSGRPEGGICEQFAYLLKSVAYPKCSDINELGETGRKERLRR